MDVLKHIQSKSSDTKARYSFVVAVVVTAAVALIWVSSLPARFNVITQQTHESTEDASDSLSNILEDANSQAASIINLKDELKRQIETSNLDELNFVTQDERVDMLSTTTDVTATTTTKEVFEEPEKKFLGEEVATTTPETVPDEPRTVLIEIKATEDSSISKEDRVVE